MSQKPLVICAVIGMSVGGYLPVLIGIDNGLGVWSILGGFVGGILGIWVGVVLGRRFG